MKSKDSNSKPETVGEHIRRCRLERGLNQQEAASLLGVKVWTVLNWEKGHTRPPIGSIPAILSFLGRDPYPASKTLSERMIATRRTMGWTIKEASDQLGVNAGTWSSWERGVVIPWQRYVDRLDKFLARINAD